MCPSENSERKRTESLLEGQKRILEMIVMDAPLTESLAALIRLIEQLFPGMLGSILLIDEAGIHLRHGAAPSLPPEYVKAIDGTAIGPQVGSCGTAAYVKAAVIVEDIATDPRWQDYRALALAHGLRACWSTPIFSAQRHLLGTFAMYYRQPGLPEPEHLQLIESTTHIAAVAISRHNDQARLHESEANVTERKQTENLLHLVLATLPVAVAVTDRTGNIVLANAKSKCLWGDTIVSAQERWTQSKGFWHDSGRRIAPEEWASVRALSEGRTSLNELIDIETFDGQRRTILNSSAPIRDAAGLIVGAVIVNEDVTELKASEEKLRQTEAELARVTRITMMGELTASIAHEVNQPLAAVVANANAASRWLAAAPPDLAEAREAVLRIARDGNRASEVIKRIRTLIKKGEPRRIPVNLNELIKETVGLSQPELNQKRVSLDITFELKLPAVPADRVQLQQVLLNLMVNALDSMNSITDRPRILRIQTDRPEPDTVQVTLQDAGRGIGPAESEHLFEPFYTTKPHGLGMGLAISRSIVEAHGGRLWASPNDGPGATFHFTLPVQEGVAS